MRQLPDRGSPIERADQGRGGEPVEDGANLAATQMRGLGKFLLGSRPLCRLLRDQLFEDRRRKQRSEESHQEELFEQIGRLKMEVEWLKKKSAQLG